MFGPVTRLKPGVNEQPDCVQLSSNASIVAPLGRETFRRLANAGAISSPSPSGFEASGLFERRARVQLNARVHGLNTIDFQSVVFQI